MEIKLATPEDLNRFFPYLNDHLSDNGVGNTAYFQPMSRAESMLSEAMSLRFSNGICINLGQKDQLYQLNEGIRINIRRFFNKTTNFLVYSFKVVNQYGIHR